MDFVETATLTGQRHYVLAAIHHASRRVRILGTSAHPTHAWVAQAIRNLVMDLEDAGSLAGVRFLIRDRDTKYPALIDEILSSSDLRHTHETWLIEDHVPRIMRLIRLGHKLADRLQPAGGHSDVCGGALHGRRRQPGQGDPRLPGATVSGSYLALSHGTMDGRTGSASA
ncbi:MAG TPA: hypothetical protein VHX38_38465 [Pseudonocardiaceae bacterium]|jgi:hypothetical protein|nr:hypothetical protein [Pseudonocardiaceae bacterium]